MLSRRAILAAGLATGLPGAASARATLGEDGLYKLDWYLESFLDLGEDLAAATAAGKRFAILWGLKGCPACRRMHEVHLADPQTERYIRENFEILHLNILGQRPVTDFDGAKLGEKAFAARYASAPPCQSRWSSSTLRHTAECGETLPSACSWKDESSTTRTSKPSGSRTASSTGVPMLPTGATRRPPACKASTS